MSHKLPLPGRVKLPQRVIGRIGERDGYRIQTALDEGWAGIILELISLNP